MSSDHERPRDDRRRAGPDVPEEQPTARRWAAGHVILAVLVGLAAGALLNAQSLLAVAERQPFGWQRDAAVAVTRPLADASASVGLDRPRRAIDVALGRGGPTTTPSEPPVDEPAAEEPVASRRFEAPLLPRRPDRTDLPEPEPELHREVSADDPLRMYVGGDSMVGQFGVAMEDLGGATGMITTTEVEYNFGSGLSRPDFMDWPARLAEVATEQDPDIVVLFYGGNDAQPLELEGVVHEPDEPEWQEEYRSRVAGLMDQLVDDDLLVYWMGMPVPRSDTMVPRLGMLNEIYASEAEAREAVTFVPSWDLFADEDGNYSEYLEDDDGNLVDMRLDDGIHLTTAGAYRLGRVTIARIAEDFDIPTGDG